MIIGQMDYTIAPKLRPQLCSDRTSEHLMAHQEHETAADKARVMQTNLEALFSLALLDLRQDKAA